MRSWRLPAALAACALAIGFPLLFTGAAVTGVLLLAWFGAVAFVCSPLVFPRSVSAAAAQADAAADGRPIVYWRPGCPYCVRLRLALGPAARRAHWVNIWNDPEGAAAVRAVADGNETVPTVVAAGEAHVNPERSLVRGWLRR